MSQHFPAPGDAVEAWLSSYRDGYDPKSSAWYAVDDLLEDYQAAADEGRALEPWTDDDVVVTE